VVELKIHLGQCLLHVLDVRGSVLQQALALTHVGSQLGNLPFGAKAGPQQPERMEPLQPLRIADIGLAPGHVLGIARVDKEYRKPAGIEKFENRNPVDAGRFHDDRLDAAFRKPVYQPMEIDREGAKAAYWLRCGICPYGCHMHGCANVDGSRVRVHGGHRTVRPGLRSFVVHLRSSC